jgi:hypothetical protein
VLGLLLEGAQRLQKEQATCVEERRLLQAREQPLRPYDPLSQASLAADGSTMISLPGGCFAPSHHKGAPPQSPYAGPVQSNGICLLDLLAQFH